MSVEDSPHPPPRPAQDGIRRRLQLLKDLAKLPLKLLFLLLTTIKYKSNTNTNTNINANKNTNWRTVVSFCVKGGEMVSLSMWPHQVVLGNFFQDVENFKMETGILNFSQVVKGTARSSKGICFLLFLVFPYNIIFLYFQIIFNVVFLYSSIRWDRLRLFEVGLVASVENTPSPLDPHFNDGTQKVSIGPYNICHGHCPLANNP